MLDGFAYVAGQVALLMVVAAVLGAAVGWLGRSLRPARGLTGLAPSPGAPVVAPDAGQPGSGSGALPSGISDAGAPTAASLPADGTREPATASSEAPGPATDTGELQQSRAEVERLRATLAEITDRKDAELGRLETAAIQALEATIAAHQTRIIDLEDSLQAARDDVQQHASRLDDESRRAERLQQALEDRDRRIAGLAAGLADRDRQIEVLGGATPSG